MDKPDDKEVIGIMIDGGERLCDYAMTQWISGKYGLSHKDSQEHYRRWQYIKRRIREIAREWKNT